MMLNPGALRFQVPAGGKKRLFALVVQHGQPDLMQVVQALRPSSRLAGRLHRRQQQRDEDADDRNHHQTLHQGKSPLRTGTYRQRVFADRVPINVQFTNGWWWSDWLSHPPPAIRYSTFLVTSGCARRRPAGPISRWPATAASKARGLCRNCRKLDPGGARDCAGPRPNHIKRGQPAVTCMVDNPGRLQRQGRQSYRRYSPRRSWTD